MKFLNTFLSLTLALSGPFAFAADNPSVLAQTRSRWQATETVSEIPAARLDRAINQMVGEMKRFNPQLDVTRATASLRRLAKLIPTYRYRFYFRRPHANSLNAQLARAGTEAGDRVVQAMSDYIGGARPDVAGAAQDAVKLAIDAALLNGVGHGNPKLHQLVAALFHFIVAIGATGTYHELTPFANELTEGDLLDAGYLTLLVPTGMLVVFNLMNGITNHMPKLYPKSISETVDSFLLDRQLERDFWPAVRARIQANARGANKELMESFLMMWEKGAAESSTFTGFLTTLQFSGWLNPRQVLPPELPDCPTVLAGG